MQLLMEQSESGAKKKIYVFMKYDNKKMEYALMCIYIFNQTERIQEQYKK